MTDTAKWVTDATEEIDKQYATWMSEITGRANRLDTIEAIILKYCPEDKAVESLLAACYLAKGFVYAVCQLRDQDPNEAAIYLSICAALAEYEKVKK